MPSAPSFIHYIRYVEGRAYLVGSVPQSSPNITVSGDGLVSVMVPTRSIPVRPTVEEGWIKEGTTTYVTLEPSTGHYQIPIYTDLS